MTGLSGRRIFHQAALFLCTLAIFFPIHGAAQSEAQVAKKTCFPMPRVVQSTVKDAASRIREQAKMKGLTKVIIEVSAPTKIKEGIVKYYTTPADKWPSQDARVYGQNPKSSGGAIDVCENATVTLYVPKAPEGCVFSSPPEREPIDTVSDRIKDYENALMDRESLDDNACEHSLRYITHDRDAAGPGLAGADDVRRVLWEYATAKSGEPLSGNEEVLFIVGAPPPPEGLADCPFEPPVFGSEETVGQRLRAYGEALLARRRADGGPDCNGAPLFEVYSAEEDAFTGASELDDRVVLAERSSIEIARRLNADDRVLFIVGRAESKGDTQVPVAPLTGAAVGGAIIGWRLRRSRPKSEATAAPPPSPPATTNSKAGLTTIRVRIDGA